MRRLKGGRSEGALLRPCSVWYIFAGGVALGEAGLAEEKRASLLPLQLSNSGLEDDVLQQGSGVSSQELTNATRWRCCGLRRFR